MTEYDGGNAFSNMAEQQLIRHLPPCGDDVVDSYHHIVVLVAYVVRSERSFFLSI